MTEDPVTGDRDVYERRNPVSRLIGGIASLLGGLALALVVLVILAIILVVALL